MPGNGLPDPDRSEPEHQPVLCRRHHPTLFGEWAVLREWGRRGSPGTLRLESYRRHEKAQAVEARTIKGRLQRGYARSDN
jgi:predicted DNA-binding WGR domain protein